MATVYTSSKSAQQAGMVRLSHHAAYLAEAAYGHTFVPTPGLSASIGGRSWIGVDKHARVYYDPAEIVKREPFEIAVIFMHEVWHTLREHAPRAEAFWASLGSDPTVAQIIAAMPQDARHKIWNLAADAEINDDLQTQFGDVKDGAALFARLVTPDALRTKFGIDVRDNATAEEYARAIIEKQIDEQGQEALDKAEGDCGGGSGADGQEQPWEAGEPSDGEGEDANGEPGDAGQAGGKPEGKDATALEVMRRETAKAIQAGKAAGDLPENMARWADAKLAPPRVRWEPELRSKVRRAVTFVTGYDDFTYSRPSYRRQAGIVLPGMQAPELNVDVVLDDSGSMGDGPDSLLARAVNEIEGICKAATTLRFTACDAAVNSRKSTRFQGSAKGVWSKFTGGGGTDMRIGIAAALANKPKPNVIVVLTDGYTPWPDKAPVGCAVVVGLVGDCDESTRNAIPRWASVVEIKD